MFLVYSYEEILIFKSISDHFSNNHQIIFGINKLDVKSGKFYNSMVVTNNKFEIIQSYNKRKLVPFGEFLPLENILSNLDLKKLQKGMVRFDDQNNNLIFDQVNILPLICYEVIFTELIQKSEDDTNIIINISEDGWFGESIGPDQHFAKSLFRAIESNTFFKISEQRCERNYRQQR